MAITRMPDQQLRTMAIAVGTRPRRADTHYLRGAQRHQPGGAATGIEQLLLDHWDNTEWRYQCSASGGLDAPLSLPTKVNGKSLQHVLTREPMTMDRSVAASVEGVLQNQSLHFDPKPIPYADLILAACKSLAKNVGFGDNYNTDRWERYAGGLRLREGQEPFDVTEEIVLGRWTDASGRSYELGCGLFTQVAQLYTRMHRIGADAWRREIGRLVLRPMGTLGRGTTSVYAVKTLFDSDSPQLVPGVMVLQETQGFSPPLTGPLPESPTTAILAIAPIGSTVTWQKVNEPEFNNEATQDRNDWYAENTLKMGEDSYWAFPLKNVPINAASVEHGYITHDQARGPAPVYIGRIEFVEHPNE